MSTSPHVNDVFDAFVAAKQAIDKVPDLEAQIEALKAQLVDQAKLKDTITLLDSQLAVAEADLEARSKSNADLQARFDLVVHTLRDLTGNITSTLGVVEPPPPPAPEPEPNPTFNEFSPSTVSDTGTQGSNSSEVSVPMDPTPNHGAETALVTTDPQPHNEYEATCKANGSSWYDTNGIWHSAGEVPSTPVAPFAPSPEAPSTTAPSPSETSTTEPPAAPSAGASSPPDIPRPPHWAV